MAVYNKSTSINRLIDDVGISSQHRSEAVRYLDANFDHVSGFLMPKAGGVGTARDALLAFKSARPTASTQPELDGPLGGEKAPVSGVSPVPVNIPAKASYQPGNPERAIADASRAAMPSGFSWDGR